MGDDSMKGEPMSATITWGELERGHRIVGGWVVADITPTHVTVASDEDGELSTFRRKDPWVNVEIETPSASEVAKAFGGHLIQEEVEGKPVTYFAWPDDRDFITAAQSHLSRQHHVDPEARDYEELRRLHQELHDAGGADHEHVDRY